MRIPVKWLAELVEVPADSTPEDIQEVLVRVGLEEEDIHRLDVSGPIVVGEVLEFDEEPQKNGKTIRWCRVRVAPEGTTAADGGDSVHGIVCGAGNFAPGDKVVVTLPGATLPGSFHIAPRKTYGHVSDGMLASASELGLGDGNGGIIRLAELGLDPDVGTDAIELLGLDDTAIEVNVTPDRGYALSLRGIAREYAHSRRIPFTDPVDAMDSTPGAGVAVAIDNSAALRGRAPVHVFATRVVSGIDATRPTPRWMSSRLELSGIRSISLPVDVTNYVMLELGQPIHAYDRDRLSDGFGVRRARAGETLTTLDALERQLDPEDIVIADASGPVGLAGVMGGAATEIRDSTRNVLIEAAGFDPVSIARTVRRHRLPSEASRRFEREVDPTVAVVAANRVASLLAELAGGTVSELGSLFEAVEQRQPIRLDATLATRTVGVAYERDVIERILTEIGASVTVHEAGWDVVPPSWRPDLTQPADLVEEIVRIDGYDKIPFTLPVAPPGTGLTRTQRLRRLSADVLAATGANEVIATPFVTAAQNARFGSADGRALNFITLANPLDQSRPQLRASLLPTLIETAARNLSRGASDQVIFESGTVFSPADTPDAIGSRSLPAAGALPTDDELLALASGIPAQSRHIGLLVLGNRRPKQVGLAAEASGIADAWTRVARLGRALGVSPELVQASHDAFHPGRAAAVQVNGVTVGIVGELHPAVSSEAHLPRVVAVAEIDLDALIALSPEVPQVRPLSTFPAATQDVSLVVADSVSAGAVLGALRTGAGELLEDIRLVDDYRGQGVAAGQKSLSFALRFRAPDRTLTAEEASAARLAGVAEAEAAFGASLRD